MFDIKMMVYLVVFNILIFLVEGCVCIWMLRGGQREVGLQFFYKMLILIITKQVKCQKPGKYDCEVKFSCKVNFDILFRIT